MFLLRIILEQIPCFTWVLPFVGQAHLERISCVFNVSYNIFRYVHVTRFCRWNWWRICLGLGIDKPLPLRAFLKTGVLVFAAQNTQGTPFSYDAGSLLSLLICHQELTYAPLNSMGLRRHNRPLVSLGSASPWRQPSYRDGTPLCFLLCVS